MARMRQAYFPFVCVDDFFNEPDKVVAYAKSLKYETDGTGRWPGARTQCLSSLNFWMFQKIISKFQSLFFVNEDDADITATMIFQRIPADGTLGWIHSDESVGQYTFMVYLNQGISMSSGTSIYAMSDFAPLAENIENQQEKIDYYHGNITKQDAEKARQAHARNFQKTLTFGSVYNRLIGFDAHMLHAAENLASPTGGERLFLICFINQIKCTPSPIQRMIGKSTDL